MSKLEKHGNITEDLEQDGCSMRSLIRFFVCSQRKNRSTLYCSSTAALVVEEGTSFRKLWENEYLLSTSFIFIPFNPKNCHWILVVVNISERDIGVLDPPVTDTHCYI